MWQDRLSRAQSHVRSLLTSIEDLVYVGVPGPGGPPEQVIALTTHRVLRCRGGPSMREWESVWWSQVANCSLLERDEEGATLTLRLKDRPQETIVVPGLTLTEGRSLHAHVEELRLRVALGEPVHAALPEREPPDPGALSEGHRGPVAPDFECGECGMAVEEAFEFCPGCGSPLREGCPSCGRAIQTDFTVCPYCASPLVQSNLDRGAGDQPVTGTWVDFAEDE